MRDFDKAKWDKAMAFGKGSWSKTIWKYKSLGGDITV
jgi:hypothetical protein